MIRRSLALLEFSFVDRFWLDNGFNYGCCHMKFDHVLGEDLGMVLDPCMDTLAVNHFFAALLLALTQ